MYSTFQIEDKKNNETNITFRFNGQRMAVENGVFKGFEISREELDALIEWLKCGLEKLNRDAWDEEHRKTCSCHGVNVTNE